MLAPHHAPSVIGGSTLRSSSPPIRRPSSRYPSAFVLAHVTMIDRAGHIAQIGRRRPVGLDAHRVAGRAVRDALGWARPTVTSRHATAARSPPATLATPAAAHVVRSCAARRLSGGHHQPIRRSDQPRSARHQVRRCPGRRPLGSRSARHRLVTGSRRPAQGPPAPTPATPAQFPPARWRARTLCRACACRVSDF